MDASETAALIAHVGGDAKFGRLLGLDITDGWQQRVNNWKRRGMPADVILEHYETIQKLKAEVAPPKRTTN